MKFSIRAKMAALCCIFLLIFIPCSIFLSWSLSSVAKNFRYSVRNFKDVVGKSERLIKLIVDMETGQRGFVITGKEEFLEPYENSSEEFELVLAQLRKSLAGHPEYLRTLEEIEHLEHKWLGVAGEPEIEMRRLAGESTTSLKEINGMIVAGKGKAILDKIRMVTDAMTSDFRAAGRKDELLLIFQIIKDVVDSETGQRGFLLAGRDGFLEPYYAGQLAFKKHTGTLQTMLQNDKENLERLSSVKNLYEKWLVEAAIPEINARVTYERDPRSIDDVAKMIAAGTGKEIIDELRTVIGGFSNNLIKDVETELSRSERSVTSANFFGLTIASIGLLLSLGVAFYLYRSIMKPIGALIDGTRTVGRGDLTHRIEVKSKDEMGLLAGSFNDMTENLSVSMEKERKGSEELRAANQQLRANEQQLKAANQQLRAAEQQLRANEQSLRASHERLETNMVELDEAKAYAENIVAHMTDALIIVGSDAKIGMANPSAEKLWGHKKDLIGKPVASIFAEEVTPFNNAGMKALLKDGSFRDRELTCRTKSGNEVPINLSAAVMKNRKGEFICIVAIIKDMREIKRLMEEEKKLAATTAAAEAEKKKRAELEKTCLDLKEKTGQLETAQQQIIQQERLRALGEMTSGVAHDFNNALMPILGFSELALMHRENLRDETKVENWFKKIGTAARGAASVVSRLREFYRKNEGGDRFELVKLGHVAKEVVSLTEPKWKDEAMAMGKKITLETDIADVPPILGDESEIREVLVNLVFNAIDAIRADGTIVIRLRTEGDSVILSVSDTGIGMKKEDAKRCLEPFFTTKGGHGSGLGLSVTHGVVRRHKGTVEIESKEGKGTTFTIRLPAASADDIAEIKGAILKEAKSSRPLHILIVDDEEPIREILIEYLTADGHTVESASNGIEGLQKFQQDKLDLVITDMAMPGMSGAGLASGIKEIAPDMPVILLTGFGELAENVAGEKIAVDHVVSKPLDHQALQQIIEKAVN